MAVNRGILGARVAVSAGALTVLAVRLIWPSLKIDLVAIGLLGLAVLPWLSNLIKSAKLPGGIEIEFQEVKSAVEQFSAGATAATPADAAGTAAPASTYPFERERDPNIALVGVRIELDRRLRALAREQKLDDGLPLDAIAGELGERRVLSEPEVRALEVLISAGRRAAHGATVSADAADWVAGKVPIVLETLRRRLKSHDHDFVGE